MSQHTLALISEASNLREDDELHVTGVTATVTPRKTEVHVLVLPRQNSVSQRVLFVLMLLAHAVSATTESARLTAVMSIFALIFETEASLYTLISAYVPVSFTVVHLEWADTAAKVVQAPNSNYALLNLQARNTSDERFVQAFMRDSQRVGQVAPALDMTIARVGQMMPYLFRQILFCFAKANTAPARAVDWARTKIRKLTEGTGRTDVNIEATLADEALVALCAAFNESLILRKMVVEVLLHCLGSRLKDDVMAAIAQQAMYLRNAGMTPLMLVKKYAIDAGYPEISQEKGIGSDLQNYIVARKTLITGGLRTAFMFYTSSHETSLMHPSRFPRLFSFAMGVGRSLEPTLADYNTTFPMDNHWLELGGRAATLHHGQPDDA